MSENEKFLERQFLFEKFYDHNEKNGWIFNYAITTNNEGFSIGSVYFFDENLKKFKISLPYYHSFLVEGTDLSGLEEYFKNKYVGKVDKTEIIKKYDCKEYNHLNKEKTEYLKIYFKSKALFLQAMKDVKFKVKKNQAERKIDKDFDYNGDDNPDTDITRCITGIHEYDIPEAIDFAITHNIRCGRWYKISYDGSIYSFKDSSIIVNPDLKILAYDIETTKKPLKFPNPDFDKIMMISIQTNDKGYLISNREIVAEDINNFEFNPKDDIKSKIDVFNEKNEESVLVRFIEILQSYRPDILTTYNGSCFDFPFIDRRMKEYSLSLNDLLSFRCINDYYSSNIIIHLDCYKWVQRDSYLPIGSQGLKAVTKCKLGYTPDELDPEAMVDLAKSDPIKLASYAISDSVSTYQLFVKYVQPHIFSLCTILPYPPCDVLCKGAGSLCEALLISEANNYTLLIPEKKKELFLREHNGQIIDSITYIGGHVESLKSGIFRADFRHIFDIDSDFINQIISDLDLILCEYKKERDYEEKKEFIRKLLTENTGKFESLGNIYHFDVGAMYPSIILTNRLQPISIVNEDICIRCDYSDDVNKCKRKMSWKAKIDVLIPAKSEVEAIKRDALKEYVKMKAHNKDSTFLHENQKIDDLSLECTDNFEVAEFIKKKVAAYSREFYKKTKNTIIEERTETVCQREIPFYVDSVRKFREQRYHIKDLYKNSLNNIKNAISEEERIIAQKESIVYSSLQVAYKCILNSFYGYIMRKGSRWYSMEMAAIVCDTGSKIIKTAKEVIDKIVISLELDTDGIWCIIPKDFPNEIKLNSGSSFSLLSNILNFYVCGKFTNDQYQIKVDDKFVTKSENSIYFEIDGPYKTMVIPAAEEEGKLLKKRYIITDFKNKITELKGFEVKRHGELEIIKRFQEELFNHLCDGNTLEECYSSLASVCDYWMSFINNKGKYLDDEELFLLFSESRKMSKDFDDYDGRSTCLTGAASKMSELLGKEILSDKLKVEFIISSFPAGEQISNRAIPTIVFKSKDCEKFIRKWCKLDKNVTIRELIDWNYYYRRMESIMLRIISIPASLQGVKDVIKDIKLPNWCKNIMTRYENFYNTGSSNGNFQSYELQAKKQKSEIEVSFYQDKSENNEKQEFNSNSAKQLLHCDPEKYITETKAFYLSYFNDLLNYTGVYQISLLGEEIQTFNSDKTRDNYDAMRRFFIVMPMKYFLKHGIVALKKIHPKRNKAVQVGLLEFSQKDFINNRIKYEKIFNHFCVEKIYHKNLPPLNLELSNEFVVPKMYDLAIISSFFYSKKAFYCVTYQKQFQCISNSKTKNVIYSDFFSFMKKLRCNYVLINLNDPNYRIFSTMLTNFNILKEDLPNIQILGGLDQLIENQKKLHSDLIERHHKKKEISIYSKIPINNIDECLLDYMFLRDLKANNTFCDSKEREVSKYQKIEKYIPGYYKRYCIKIELKATRILSIIETDNIFTNERIYEGMKRKDFEVLQNLVKKILIDASSGIVGAIYVLEMTDKWLYSNSIIIPGKLQQVCEVLVQKYLLNLYYHLRQLKINVFNLCNDTFYIETDKTTKEGVNEFFKYLKRKINSIPGYGLMNVACLKIYERILFLNPVEFFYVSENRHFCFSNISIPIDYLKKYFDDSPIESSYVYDLIMKIERKMALLIVTTLECRDDLRCFKSSSLKLLKENEYTYKFEDIFINVKCVCPECSNTTVLRKRCVKCGLRYSKRFINQVLFRYFIIILSENLSADEFCNRCNKIKEYKFKKNCWCGGVYKKKSNELLYKKLFAFIEDDAYKKHLMDIYKTYCNTV